MPAPERNRWVEWWAIAKERKEVAKVNVAGWWMACREEPSLLWQTPAVRYATYVMGGLVLVFALRTAIEMFQPVPSSAITPRASTAYFNVICANQACGKNFAIERKFRFDDFPVTCPHCQQPTGLRAMRCYSDLCRGRLVKTQEVDGRIRCVECGEVIGS